MILTGRLRLPLAPRPSPDDEQNQRSQLLYALAWGTMGVAVVALLAIAILQPSVRPLAFSNIAFVVILGLILLELNRRGWTRLASWVLVVGLITRITWTALAAGGIRSPGVGAFLIFALMAGLLLGQEAGIASAIACALISLSLAIAERAGWLPPAAVVYTPGALWLIHVMYLGVAMMLLHLSTRTLTRASDAAHRELQRRNEVMLERERLLQALEERVKELRLLHAAARLLQSDRPFTRAVLERLVGMMPQAWLHPNACEARIAYQDIEVTTAGWQDSRWRQRVSFSTTAGTGVIEVIYRTEQQPEVEGPFLAEERTLLESLAEILSAYLEHDAAEQRRLGLETQLRQAQKMDALGTLAGGIAHDFNNILTAIVANVDLCQLELPVDHPAQSLLNEVAKASARASDLVQRVLTFSHRQETSKALVALGPVVTDAVQLLRASLPKTIDIRVSCADDVPPIYADATQIHQIVMNLGTNARHAMADAGGVMTVAVDHVTLGEHDTPPSLDLNPGSYVRLSVRDTGTGMSGSTMERLFDPFFTTKGTEGTGLGLSVVHGIVREHGGAIVVRSTLGEGSMFDVWLPAAATGGELQAVPAHLMRPGHGEHILYVDDEEALVVAMTRTLERLGYRCTGFTDPDRALQAFRTTPHAFDAALVDLAMPTMSGLDLVRGLRAIRGDVPVAVTSGYAVEDPDAVQRAGVIARLAKPVTRDNLTKTLETLLSTPV